MFAQHERNKNFKFQNCDGKMLINLSIHMQPILKTDSKIAHASPIDIESEIIDLVRDHVGPVVDVDVALAQQGVDSLSTLKLRKKFQV
jgi:hypothetical protein